MIEGWGPLAAQACATPVQNKLRLRMRILATTDLHGHLLSYDYFANRPQFGAGLLQTASLIANARAEVAGSLLFDNGDFLQGSGLMEFAIRHRGRSRPHPAIAAFNALGYDAVALGNHEFNYGLPPLMQALEAAQFPVLSANVFLRPETDQQRPRPLVRPWVMLERDLADDAGQLHRLRIGVLGLTPPQIVDWDREALGDQLIATSMVDTVRALIPEIRAAGADVVVCLAHTGVHPDSRSCATEAEAIDISMIEGVDAVIAGHSHLIYPPPNPSRSAFSLSPSPSRPAEVDPGLKAAGASPIVQPGHSGSHLGQIDLWLEQVDGRWTVGLSDARVISTSEVVAGLHPAVVRRNAHALREALAPDHRRALAWMRREIGSTQIPLTSFFSTAVDTQVMRVTGAALADRAKRALRGRPEADLPFVTVVNPYRCGGRGGTLNYTKIQPGPLTLRSVYDLYPFPNRLVAELVRGADLYDRVLRASAIWRQITPGGADQLLTDPAIPPYTFEVLTGLSYRIDLSRPSVGGREQMGQLGRVTDLRYNGVPVTPDAQFVMVTNSFLSAATPTPGGKVLLDGQVTCAEAIADWLSCHGPVAPIPGAGWSFNPMPGTTVLYDSGAGALEHLSDIAFLRPALVGVTPEGFHRFRLHL